MRRQLGAAASRTDDAATKEYVDTETTVPLRFGTPNFGFYTAGLYYDAALHGTTPGTAAWSAGRIDLSPFFVSSAVPIDQIGVAVSTAATSALAKVLIYGADANGWPGAKLYQSADLDCSTTGYKFATLSFTFQPNTIYWLGIWTSAAQTLRTINAGVMPVIGGLNAGGNGTNYNTIIRRVVTYSGGVAPDPWTFNSAELTYGSCPSVRFRAA